MDFFAIAKCPKCNGEHFEIYKSFNGKTRESAIYHETLCHDGYGWDLNGFTFVCVNPDCDSEIINIHVIEDNEPKTVSEPETKKQ